LRPDYDQPNSDNGWEYQKCPSDLTDLFSFWIARLEIFNALPARDKNKTNHRQNNTESIESNLRRGGRGKWRRAEFSSAVWAKIIRRQNRLMTNRTELRWVWFHALHFIRHHSQFQISVFSVRVMLWKFWVLKPVATRLPCL